ncbi:transcriptional regulator [Bergeyella cardium]|uniref:Transcriptional regulator n=1 Tax=Bergeyella cardium TaxID=1585976 RepID=A0A6P1QU86_9FLAO|nr:transcriptional regulator [Bergeyella cardium]QHN64603.1 transcriptional regulator [Bergeyella cardium]WHE33896.1 transcriptional regulator [Bergeyella cardium]WHF60546.1 transcriptional regulator [Bergeyella cardium]
MNYTELISKFWSINEKTPLGASAVALYLFLLEEWRKNNGENFSISDGLISQKLSLTRPTIVAMKSKLRNIGLIQYHTKNGMPCIYRIISDFSFLQEPITKQEPVKNDVGSQKLTEENIVKVVEKKSIDKIPVEIVEQSAVIEIPSTPPPVRENIDIPSLQEFMDFAKTLEAYDESMDFAIKSKYESWVDAGWKNGLGMPLIKWQNNLKNTIPHLRTNRKPNLSINKIPTINRPKTTYNE